MSDKYTKQLTGQDLKDYIESRFPKKLNDTVEIEEDMSVQDLAKEASQYMTTGKRDNGDTFYKTTDNRPEWFRDLVHSAHDDYLPDDYRYRWIAYALDAFSSYDDAEQAIDEIEPDCYNFDLLKWVGSNLYRMGYVDEVLSSGSFDSLSPLASSLACAQAEEMRETYCSVLASLQQELTNREHD